MQLSADMIDAGSALPVDFDIGEPVSTAIPALIEAPAETFFGPFAFMFASITSVAGTPTFMLRRRTVTRTNPWEAPSSETTLDYILVGYVNGPEIERKGSVIAVEYKVMFAASALTTVPSPTDSIVIGDQLTGKEYPIRKLKRTPRHGSDIIFWTAIVGLDLIE